MESRIVRHGLALTDRIALVALAGIVVSLASWVVFAYVDATVLLQSTFRDELISPPAEQILARLATVVLVLVGTLVIQVLYSRRIQVEDRLKLAETRIVQMYENSPDSVLCVGQDYSIVYANRVSRKQAAGHDSAREPIGEVCYRTIWGRSEPCDGCLVADVFATAAAHDRTVSDTSSGTARYLEQVVYPVLDDDGAVECVVEATRDATDRMLAQQAIRQMARGGSFN